MIMGENIVLCFVNVLDDQGNECFLLDNFLTSSVFYNSIKSQEKMPEGISPTGLLE